MLIDQIHPLLLFIVYQILILQHVYIYLYLNLLLLSINYYLIHIFILNSNVLYRQIHLLHRFHQLGLQLLVLYVGYLMKELLTIFEILYRMLIHFLMVSYFYQIHQLHKFCYFCLNILKINL